MTGIAALAMCFGFTSCSHDIEPASQEDLNNLEAAQIVNAYNQAFIKTFGQPAADQDWGFGTTTRGITRAHTYMNGNMEKYYDAPTRGANEETDVEAYVHSLTVLPAKAAPDWDTYFVTQIHEGTASYNTQKTVDKTTEYVAGNQMDELAFAMVEGAIIKDDGTLQGDWIHINNFNSAQNTDWNGNTLVEEGGTVDFAYKSSADSKYHNRWIGIDGKDVPNSQGKLGDYDDYYYICFDFESTGNAKTVIKWKDANGNPQQAYLIGSWTDITKVPTGTTVYNSSWDSKTNSEVFTPTGTCVRDQGTNYWELDNVVNGNMVVVGNNDYTDWIVRLYKAKSKSTPTYDVRIIAEDLNATAQDGDLENSDWDFNDVVFDVNFTSDNDAEVTLIAAGGTLPLIVGVKDPVDGQSYPDNEVHSLFGVPVNYMVNTNAEAKGLTGGAPAVGHAAPQLNLHIEGVKASNGNLIPIHVQKTLKDGTKKWFELTARRGQPAAKLAVNSKSTKFSICDEREDITKKYTNFKSWVVNNDPLIWWE